MPVSLRASILCRLRGVHPRGECEGVGGVGGGMVGGRSARTAAFERKDSRISVRSQPASEASGAQASEASARIGVQGQPHFCAQPTRERSERGASERSERARDHVRSEHPLERSFLASAQ